MTPKEFVLSRYPEAKSGVEAIAGGVYFVIKVGTGMVMYLGCGNNELEGWLNAQAAIQTKDADKNKTPDNL